MRKTLTRRRLLGLSAAAALTLPILPARAVASRPASVVVWTDDSPEFGGFSGIELMPDRLGFYALSDRGHLLEGRLSRDAEGRLTGVTRGQGYALRGSDGGGLGPHNADAEGLSLDPNGALVVAFEGGRRSRIARYATPGGRAQDIPGDPAWRGLPGNQGLECLAIDAGGRLYTIPETPDARGFPLYRQAGDGWRVIASLPAEGNFAPVGADFGPDGNLYLLERKFRLAFFGTRISRLRPGAWDQREVLAETGYGLLDNHEGISVTADPNGRLWATTISDDNQNRFQRTEIAEFLLG